MAKLLVVERAETVLAINALAPTGIEPPVLVAQVRRAVFDDGPETGWVHITLVSMLAPDGVTEYIGSFRADRPAELGSYTLTLAAALDAEHWTMVAEQQGFDDNRPALIRETTVRDGASLVTLKQVDFSDDEVTEWFDRTRTVLQLAED